MGIQLSLEPPGVHALLGVPAGELANIDVHAREVLGSFAAELSERVRQARTWPERFAVLDALLLRHLEPERQPRAEAAAAWEVLARSHGQVSVAEVADELGWSERYLGQRFAGEFGLSPKVVARVMRFDRARRQLQQGIVSGRPPAVDGPGAGVRLLRSGAPDARVLRDGRVLAEQVGRRRVPKYPSFQRRASADSRS